MTEMSFFREQEIARKTARMHAVNKGRLATTMAVYQTNGVGSFEFEDCADFDCTYIEEPLLSTGRMIDVDGWLEGLQDAGHAKDQPNLGASYEGTPLPIVTGHVTAWEQDDNGYYVGAWCAVAVHFPQMATLDGVLWTPAVPDLSADGLPEIRHHFRFEGVALKGGEDPGGDAPNGGSS